MRAVAAVFTTVALIAGCAEPAQDDAGTDFSESVAVGERNVFLTCQGRASADAPTVVLISGYHDSSDVWIRDDVLSLLHPAAGPPVFSALARSHRVCAYDRPGTIRYVDDAPLTDRSSAVPQPRTVAEIVTELHATLAAAEVPEPYLVVGHSLGGLITRAYAQTHSDQVAGVVFVDAFSPTVPEILGEDAWTIYRDDALNPPADRMPVPSMQGPDSERVDLDASVAEVLDGPAFPQVPTVVLTKTESFAGLTDLPGLPASVINRSYQGAQQSFVDLVPNTPQIIATGSDHYIQFSQPDLVVAAVDLVGHRISEG